MLRACVHRFAVDLNQMSQHIKPHCVPKCYRIPPDPYIISFPAPKSARPKKKAFETPHPGAAGNPRDNPPPPAQVAPSLASPA
ncbi:hypothetical protein JYU34_022742 [Plutella xylostella]|uniref:Uncharacterized protein n=1 Tax=Plutella xylostella TaxID=51655 RepID=A0ABQ7PR21_PLUXY|nr:hypothetical protein JYU34_022742 [Plutella xylostella]